MTLLERQEKLVQEFQPLADWEARYKKLIEIGRTLVELGFSLVATRGTAATLGKAGLAVAPVNKVMEGRPHIVDMLKNKEITLIINTVEEDKRSIQDSWSIRNAALQGRITYYTTISGARAACVGMQHLAELKVYDLQSLHKLIKDKATT